MPQNNRVGQNNRNRIVNNPDYSITIILKEILLLTLRLLDYDYSESFVATVYDYSILTIISQFLVLLL